MTEGEIVEWHHRVDEHEFEQTPGVGDGKGRLVCYSSLFINTLISIVLNSAFMHITFFLLLSLHLINMESY